MENGLFWLSAVLTVGVLALTWALRAWRAHPGEESPPASSLPKE